MILIIIKKQQHARFSYDNLYNWQQKLVWVLVKQENDAIGWHSGRRKMLRLLFSNTYVIYIVLNTCFITNYTPNFLYMN